MAVTLLNDWEGQTSGTGVSLANSAASGDALNTTSFGATCTYDNTTAAHGTISTLFAAAGSGVVSLYGWTFTADNQVTARVFINLSALPTGTEGAFLQFRSGAGVLAEFRVTTAGLVKAFNGGTSVFTSATALSTATWYRVDASMTISATVGQVKIDVSTPTGTSPIAGLTYDSGLTLNTGTTQLAAVRVGKITSATSSWSAFNTDGFAVATATSTYFGPFSSTVTGTLTASVPTVTASIAGTATNAGTLAANVPTVTGSITGASVNAATLSATVPTVTFSETGTSTNAGTLTAQVPTLTFSESGQSVNAATVSAQVPLLTFSDSGASTNAGTLATKVPLLTWSQTDTGINPGTMNATLPTLTFSEIGQATNPGTLSGSVPLLKYAQADTSIVLRDITVTAVALAPRFTTSPLTARFTTNPTTARFATAALPDRFSTLPVAPRFTTTPEDT